MVHEPFSQWGCAFGSEALQTFPQVPQLYRSLLKSTQDPEHSSTGQSNRQSGALHTYPGEHAWSQEPHVFGWFKLASQPLPAMPSQSSNDASQTPISH